MNGKFADKQLTEKLRSAYTEHGSDDIPELDMSFMDEEYVKVSPAKKSRKWTRIAAMIACVIALSSLMTVWINSNSALGAKTLLYKVRQVTGGMFAGSGPAIVEEDGVEKMTVTDESDMDDAKDFFPEMIEPTYIPEGYRFESLTIEKPEDEALGNMTEYVYANGDKKLYMGQLTSVGEDDSTYVSGEGYTIDMSDRKIFVTKDESTKKPQAAVFIGNAVFTISGDATEKEMIKVAKKVE
ncbi:MAG: DUF4367 domain-containing protein [Eubacteriaceae bacterium]|nr:DUF4367 domain-containing protein [Eubacteriaceae bacterium]